MRRALVVLLVAAAAAAAWLAARPPPSRAGARTIVLFTFDTLRRDRVGAYGASPSPTPRLDALAAEGVLVRDARTPVPLTLPAHATMLTGLPPAATGVRLNSAGRVPPAGERPFGLLPERLRAEGWRTGAFVSATPLVARYGLDQGFERYDDEGLDDLSGLSFVERPGAQTVARALAWVRSLPADARAFLFVHVFEPHAPYAPYEADVARADAALGALLDGLPAAGRADPVVLATADHGEALGDLGEPTHGLLLGDAVLRVPLVLRVPGRAPGVLPGPADVADVAPTLAALAGLSWEASGPGSGLDLLAAPPPADRIRVAESLYANHRHGWAQLAAAAAPEGGLLVDAGAGRALWLEPAATGEPQALPRPTPEGEPVRRLADAIAAYKQLERADLITEGAAPGGYAQAGRATPFLPGEANGRLPDPYARIPASVLLDRRAQALRQGALPPPRAAEAFLGILEADPGNAEAWFWLGEARRMASPPDLAGAEAAYLEAWKRGRRDPSTLFLAAGVNAADREGAMLDRLAQLGREVRWDCALWVLKARLLRALGRPEDACDALAEASRVCARERDRETLERERREAGCR